MENFNVGQEIMLYSRTFKITVSTKEYPVFVSEDLNKIVESCIVKSFYFCEFDVRFINKFVYIFTGM